MGTNYYANVKPCKCCKKPEKQMHIGKSSYGWTFTFHAVDEWESIDKKPINSWKRWQEVLSSPDITITNENDEDVSMEDFRKLVESKKKERNNHVAYCRQKGSAYSCRKDFMDDEGNAFTGEVFS